MRIQALISYVHRRLKMNLSTIRSYVQACRCGSKYIYQALSRLLTLWLNVVGNDLANDVYALDEHKKIQVEVAKAVRSIPSYKVSSISLCCAFIYIGQWYTALPQIISRVGHPDQRTYGTLEKLIREVTIAFPAQGLWQLISVVKSNQSSRRKRGLEIMHKLKVISILVISI